MPASFILSIFLAFLVGAALQPLMKIIGKRKKAVNTTDTQIQRPETRSHGDGLNGKTERIPSSHPCNTSNRSHLESVVRSISAPLNAMVGNMELIEHSHFSEEQGKRWKAVRLASESMLKKVSDTLEYCKLENNRLPVEHMDFDACEMVARSISPFTSQARSKNVSIHMRCAQFPLRVRNDQFRISKILGHLLENSVQFTDEGCITVKVETETVDTDQHLLRLVVEDSGTGIPPELQERIFHPFVSSTGSDDNLGLGLAICQRLCNTLNASISVTSTPGSGSRFTMDFPCPPSPAVPPRNASHRDALKGHSTLFICSDKQWHDSIIPYLKHWGLQVEAYDDPGLVEISRIKTASCVVLFGTSCQWSATAENEIIAEAAYVIEGSESNPLEMKKAGRTMLISCFSLASLFKALEHAASASRPGAELAQALPSYTPTAPPAHVVEAFKKSLQTSLRNIRLSIDSENGAMVIQELHNLSGSLAVLHSPEFSRTCIDLENRIKMDGLATAMPELENLMRLLKIQLEENTFSMKF